MGWISFRVTAFITHPPNNSPLILLTHPLQRPEFGPTDSEKKGRWGGQHEQSAAAEVSSSRWGQVVCKPPCVSHTLNLEAKTWSEPNRTDPTLKQTYTHTYIHTYIHTYDYMNKYIIIPRPAWLKKKGGRTSLATDHCSPTFGCRGPLWILQAKEICVYLFVWIFIAIAINIFVCIENKNAMIIFTTYFSTTWWTTWYFTMT